MSFLFRAVLVIGVLSYFAMQRQDTVVKTDQAGTLAERAAATLPAAWNGLPTDARQRVAREGASEITRRLSVMARSEDTLGATDRRPDWRGVAGR